MKKTFKFSTLLATTVFALSYATSVFADTPSTTQSHGVINFLPNNDSVGPLDPNNPDNPGNGGDPDDPGNHGTGNKGPLSLDFVSNINFGKEKIGSGEIVARAINKTPYVEVSDFRSGDSGWTLSAKMSKPLTNDKNQSVINGAIISWKDGKTEAKSNNSSVSPINSNIALDKTGASDTVMEAESNKREGHGTWIDVFDGSNKQQAKKDAAEVLGSNEKVTLTVPSNQVQNGVYHAEITWSLADAPK